MAVSVDNKVVTGASIKKLKEYLDDRLAVAAPVSKDDVNQYVGVDVSRPRNLCKMAVSGSSNTFGNAVWMNSGTYRVYGDVVGSAIRFCYSLFDRNGNIITSPIVTSARTELSFNATSAWWWSGNRSYTYDDITLTEGCYLSFAIYNATSFANIMITEGTGVYAYIPYVEQLKDLRPHSNRNLLDNPWFTINQRGATSYSGSNSVSVYTVDRWFMAQYSSGDSVTVTSNGITWTANASGRYLRQVFENYVLADCGGKKVTISVLFSDGTVKSVTLTCPTSGNRVNDDYAFGNIGYYLANNYSGSSYLFLRSTSAFTVNIRAVKLELGDQSTLQYDSAPNYTEELLKCQRYYWKTANGSVPYRSYSNSNSSNLHVIELVFPTEMRAIPTFDYTTNADKANMYTQVSKVGFSLYSFLYPNSFTITGFEASADL